jgi:glucose/arabinose dehydrogenase
LKLFGVEIVYLYCTSTHFAETLMKLFALSTSTLALAAAVTSSAVAKTFDVKGTAGSTITATEIASFNSGWAMTFINDQQLLVTTKPGRMWLVGTDGKKAEVSGVPKAAVGGQGGLGDIVPHPDFAKNQIVYLSYVESKDNGATRGSVVVRAKLNTKSAPKLTNIERIWTQLPKLSGRGHFSHKIAFGPKGSSQDGKLFITSGDRQQQTPAQDWDKALGKIIRLNDDGSIPADNPYQDKGELAKSYWTVGHRNLLGISFDAEGKLWSHEMGPKHGDELNLIEAGKNYGWPVVSNGNNYSGSVIPNHDTRPEFEAPKAYWVPSIAPSGLVMYSGNMFPQFKGNALIGGLVSRALVRVTVDGEQTKEAERFKWSKRIREVEQAPDGSLYVLEDRDGGRLLRVTPN